jgi:hypothetical protein
VVLAICVPLSLTVTDAPWKGSPSLHCSTWPVISIRTSSSEDAEFCGLSPVLTSDAETAPVPSTIARINISEMMIFSVVCFLIFSPPLCQVNNSSLKINCSYATINLC